MNSSNSFLGSILDTIYLGVYYLFTPVISLVILSSIVVYIKSFKSEFQFSRPFKGRLGVATNYDPIGLENPRRGRMRNIIQIITDVNMALLSTAHFFRTYCTICPYCPYYIYLSIKRKNPNQRRIRLGISSILLYIIQGDIAAITYTS